jgi:hypothetical protein
MLCLLLLLLLQVPDLDCADGKGIRRLDRYDQLSAYLLVSSSARAVTSIVFSPLL